MEGKSRVLVILAICFMLLWALPAMAVVRYVDAAKADDSGDGLSWDYAKKTVQSAIDTAASSGDQIWIKNGLYQEHITVNKDIDLYGGFSGTETSLEQRPEFPREDPDDDDYNSILDGTNNGLVMSVGAYKTVRVDGFTVKNGYNTTSNQGGGINGPTGSVLTIVNNTFKSNTGEHAGGLLVGGTASSIVSSNVFSQNSAINSAGGGIYLHAAATITGNLFYNNTGRGLHVQDTGTPIVEWNTFSENQGGILITCSNGLYANNIIKNNTSAGGITIHGNSASPTIACNIIYGNYSASCGGGIYCDYYCSPDIVNNTIVDNSCNYSWGAGGIYVYFYSTPTISNNVIAFNIRGIRCVDYGSPALINNCVYGNTDGDYPAGLLHDTDINDDPLFVDEENGDYHLTSSSPCIDAGEDDEVDTGWVDIDGELRLVDMVSGGDKVDIGADEYADTTAPSTPIVTDDGSCQSSTSSLHATWSANDSESGIVEYKYALGTSSQDPGCGYLVAWTSAGTNTSVSLSSLSLQSGWVYYFYVKAKNGSGIWSDVGVSDGIIIGSGYSEADIDILGGWGDFAFSADTTWQSSTTYAYGAVAATADDSVAVAWHRFCPDTVTDQNRIFRIAQSQGINNSSCQYLALKNITSAGPYARLQITLPIVDDDPRGIHHGDELEFCLDYIYMEDYSGVPVVYKIAFRDGIPPLESKNLTASSTNFSESVFYTIPANASYVSVYVQIQATGDIGTHIPGMYVDGAHLYVTRSGQQSRAKEVIPAPRPRNTMTTLTQYNFNNDKSFYNIASKYDIVMFQFESQYPYASRLKYYNPDIKVYLYESGGNIADMRENGEDPWYSNCPIGFAYILNIEKDGEWLYPTDGGYVPYDSTGLYFANVGDATYQTAWWAATMDKVERYQFNGVWIDTLETNDAVGEDYPGRDPNKCQSFLHAMPASFKTAGYRVTQNACTAHLKEGYDDSLPYALRKYVEQGLIYLQPGWQPNDEYTTGYSANSANGSDTADAFFQEYAFFPHAGAGMPNQYSADAYKLEGTNIYIKYWNACLNDMDRVASINASLDPGSYYKMMHMLVTGTDSQDDPKSGINGWGHYGFCSYLLAVNNYTTIEVSNLDITADLARAACLETASGARSILTVDECVQIRYFANGLVIVNSRPNYVVNNVEQNNYTFTPASTVYEEVTGTSYGPSNSFTLAPHTGRMFFYANPE